MQNCSQKWYRELEAASSKIPILSVREPGKKLRLAVVDMDYMVSILKGAGVIETKNS